MNRRKPSITPALCVSLIAHGLGLSAMAWWVVLRTPAPKLAALDKMQLLLDSLPRQPAPPPLQKPLPKEAQPKPPEPPKKKPPVKFDKPSTPAKDDSGEQNGKGTANRSTEGNRPMLANAGLEQADLMKEADRFADEAFLPASKGEVKGNNAPPQKSANAGTPAKETTAAPKPGSDQPVSPSVDHMGADAQKPAAPAGAPQSGSPNPQSNLPKAQTATPKPVEKEIRGHRATLSDTESVAFARADNVTFRAGRVEGRQGLKVKSTMPRFGLASEIDLQDIGRLHLVLGVTVDADGTPQDVVILESSGSKNVDLDCKNEVYNRWSLEPRKDKDGHVIDNTWVINFE